MSTKSQNRILDGTNLTSSNIVSVAKGLEHPTITEETLAKIAEGRARLEEMVDNDTPIYGVTTGFGEMVYITVDKKYEKELQENLLRSHCAGVSEPFSKEEARAIMTARLNAFCKGYSGISPELVERFLLYLKEDIIPVIPQVGSLGASGDLAPLAHVAITLIGEGYVFDENGEKTPTKHILDKKGLTPLQLKFKEGLALINGTSAMTGVGSLVLHYAENQVKQAEVITALALEALNASRDAFQEEGHVLARPHKGQVDCASNMRQLTETSKLMDSYEGLASKINEITKHEATTETDVYLQKAYTLRCIPQIIGAIRNTIYHAQETLHTEINSANDNPLFFEGDKVFHGGNFHGQPIAFVMDFLAISLTKLGVVSERRINRLLNKSLSNGLPEFLTPKSPGLSCGFAGAQYPATALVAENRTICSPASIQSIPSNSDNQDVVSMGLISARHARSILNNNNYILAIEYLAAAQAIDIKNSSAMLSKAGKAAYNLIRENVSTLQEDRYFSDDIECIAKLLSEGELLKRVQQVGIELI